MSKRKVKSKRTATLHVKLETIRDKITSLEHKMDKEHSKMNLIQQQIDKSLVDQYIQSASVGRRNFINNLKINGPLIANKHGTHESKGNDLLSNITYGDDNKVVWHRRDNNNNNKRKLCQIGFVDNNAACIYNILEIPDASFALLLFAKLGPMELFNVYR